MMKMYKTGNFLCTRQQLGKAPPPKYVKDNCSFILKLKTRMEILKKDGVDLSKASLNSHHN